MVLEVCAGVFQIVGWIVLIDDHSHTLSLNLRKYRYEQCCSFNLLKARDDRGGRMPASTNAYEKA